MELAAAVGAAIALTTAGAAATAPAAASPTTPLTTVIVRAADVDAATAAVESVGGTVTRPLELIGGVSASVPAALVHRVASAEGVLAVTPDARGRLLAVDPELGYDAVADFGSMYNVGLVANAQAAWRAGFTGKGVDVALIDSGVSQVTGLTSGNVVNGPDLSFESQDGNVAHRDTFGHGTHMAGIIAGRDAAAAPRAYADAGRFVGIAPDSRLISVKVASADGGVDVSQVIAALGWVTEHARDPGMNIRVVNLSFGTDSTQSHLLDPLSYAAEAAWRNGIVVVAAGGNDGTDVPTLSNPAINPSIIAVGAHDPMGTVKVTDDTVPAFATRGTATRHVDLVAPGVRVISLRVPGSYIDQVATAGRAGTRFQRGSGTSQATAVVSGAAAVLLQKYPKATPDQVKKILMMSATAFPQSGAIHRGAGALNVGKALATTLPAYQAPRSAATGTGTLQGARGSSTVVTNGVTLTGEIDIFGKPWDGGRWAPAALGRRSWTGGTWNGSTWTGSGWTEPTWLGAAWARTVWSGNDWSGSSWTGHSWTGHSWTSAGWDGHSWTGHSWTGHSWTGHSWTGHSWTGHSWTGHSWTASSWAGASWS